MRTVVLRNTGLRTSRLGFGTASLHHLLSSSARQALLSQVWEAGIRYFDTAPYYGHEMAERELGRFLPRHRADIVLATKSGIRPDRIMSRVPVAMYAEKVARRLGQRIMPAGLRAPAPARDYSARYTRRSLERSLRLLRTDYIDIFFLHDPNLASLGEAEAVLELLEEAQRAGKIRHFGLSGTVVRCEAIVAAHPQLAPLLQLEVPHPADAVSVAGRPAQITFGHFRNASAPPQPVCGGDAELRAIFTRAGTVNPDGVLLFATRSAERVHAAVRMLQAVEGPADAPIRGA